MSRHDDPVQPTPFDVATPAPVTAPVADKQVRDAAKGSPRWVWPALGVLLLVAVAVIVWLPASLDPKQTDPVASSNATAAPDTTTHQPASDASSTAAGSDVAPWSDAQSARARREAQEAAAELLELQYSLEERGVESWATESFSSAKEAAAEGDSLYKNGEYAAATDQYQKALLALQALEQSIPAELERLLSEARQALEDGDAQSVQATLSVATVLSPDNPDIATLQARAEVLPQLLSLLEQATSAEAADDLASAQSLLQQANTLDPAHQRTQGELHRVSTLAQARAFNAAMSEGYAALDQGQFDLAREAFRRAANLQEGSAEATSALQEVDAAQTAGRLTSLEQRGRSYENSEQWQKAVDAYQQAQKIDGSVLFAREGLARSRARADLDRQLQKIIEEPRRLSDVSVAAATEQLLARAGQVSPGGPRLTSQLTQLQTLLAQSNSPVMVTLRSDSETEVTVYKVARLGRFAQHELTLRPGTYTAVGSRDGYRDVRRSFTLTHDSTPPPVTIICTEPI